MSMTTKPDANSVNIFKYTLTVSKYSLINEPHRSVSSVHLDVETFLNFP